MKPNTQTFSVCANCGGAVERVERELVCRDCHTKLTNGKKVSSLAPSPEQIAETAAELRKCPVRVED